MNLNTEQIDYLHRFVKRKYVDYYDVQTELVDHLATAIEAKITEQPKLDFYTALQNEYDSFGRFGFMKFVEEKEKQVQRRFRKMYQREVNNFFTIPKILFTLVVFFLSYQFYLITDYETSRILTLALITLLVAVQVAVYIYEKLKLKKELISSGPVMTVPMVLNIFNQCSGLFAYKTLYNNNIWWLPVLTTAIVVANFSNFIVSRKLRTEQQRLYPEAFAV